MRVMQVHGRYRSAAPSGENRVVDQELGLLRDAGHDVELFERRSDDIAGWSMLHRATIPARVIWDPGSRRDLVARLEEAEPDVVHVHNTFPLLSPSVLYACRAAGVPVVVTLHNYKLLCASGEFLRKGAPCHDCADGRTWPAAAHGCYRGSRLMTLPVTTSTAVHRQSWRRLVSAYVFISGSQRDLMAGLGLDPERVFVKHNFVPDRPPPARTRAHRVAYLGRLDAAKGIPLLMRAWDLFEDSEVASSLRLVIAGGGPLEDRVRAWAADRPRVDFVGVLSPHRASELLRGSLAAVVPSQWEETFGLVAVEAMASGVAPIAPARGSFPEIVTHGEDGLLFEPASCEELAVSFARVDKDPEGLVRLGQHGRTTHAARFSGQANLAQLLEIYEFARSRPMGAPRAFA